MWTLLLMLLLMLLLLAAAAARLHDCTLIDCTLIFGPCWMGIFWRAAWFLEGLSLEGHRLELGSWAADDARASQAGGEDLRRRSPRVSGIRPAGVHARVKHNSISAAEPHTLGGQSGSSRCAVVMAVGHRLLDALQDALNGLPLQLQCECNAGQQLRRDCAGGKRSGGGQRSGGGCSFLARVSRAHVGRREAEGGG